MTKQDTIINIIAALMSLIVTMAVLAFIGWAGPQIISMLGL